MACPAPESIHPFCEPRSWLGLPVATGYPALSHALPGGGWPTGTLVELLVQQAGVGEMRLLRPALVEVSKRPIAMIQPPHPPQALAFANLGLPPRQLLASRPTDCRRPMGGGAIAACRYLWRPPPVATARPQRRAAPPTSGRAERRDAVLPGAAPAAICTAKRMRGTRPPKSGTALAGPARHKAGSFPQDLAYQMRF
jgi:hypothetical protein